MATKISELTEVTTPLGADVLPIVSGGATKKTTLANAINKGLPAQTGNNGKGLKTDGTNTSWAAVGDASGPGGATADAVALFDGTSGKLLKNSAKTLPAGDIVGTSAAQTLTNKVLGDDNDVAGQLGFAAGVRQAFAPNATTPGVNVGSVSSDPSTLVNGDMWYNSTANALKARINGASVALGAGGGGSPGGSDGDLQRNNSGAFAGSWLAQSGNQIVVASGKQIKGAVGSAAAPSFAVGQDDLGFFRAAADTIGLAHYGTRYQQIGWNSYEIERDDGYFGLNGTVKYKRNADGDALILTGTGRAVTSASDFEVTDSSKGLVLKSGNGTRYRVTVNNMGMLITTAI